MPLLASSGFEPIQFLREKNFIQAIPRVKVKDGEEIRYEAVTAAIRRSAHYLAALQADDGHWPAENSGPMFYHPPMVYNINFKINFYLFQFKDVYYLLQTIKIDNHCLSQRI